MILYLLTIIIINTIIITIIIINNNRNAVIQAGLIPNTSTTANKYEVQYYHFIIISLSFNYHIFI